LADVTVKRAEDLDTAFGGGMLKVRSGLGVTSFGVQELRFPPNADQYPEHDHPDGQEEVYIAIEGAATLQVGGEEHRLEPGVFARVGGGEKRKIVTGEEGARIIAIGAIPGKAYEVLDYTN